MKECEPFVTERRRHEVKELRKWMLYLCREKKPKLYRYKKAGGLAMPAPEHRQVKVRVKGLSVREQLLKKGVLNS